MSLKINRADLSGHIWTFSSIAAANILPSALIFVCTRLAGVWQVGVLSYAISLAQLLQTVLLYGMRPFIATDINLEYSFSEYMWIRVCGMILSGAFLFFFLMFAGFDTTKVLVIIWYYFYKASEAVSDTFEGSFQRRKRMDAAGMLRFFVNIAAITAFTAIMLYTNDMVLAVAVMLPASALTIAVFVWRIRNFSERFELSVSAKKLKRLLTACFPLFASNFLMFYLLDAQKYAIDKAMSPEALAHYTILVLPSYFVNLMSTSIFLGPELPKLSNYRLLKQFNLLIRRVKIQYLFIVCISVAVIILGCFWGISLLSFIYGVDLSGYRVHFIVLLLGGVFGAVNSVTGHLLVVFRRQKLYLAGYITIAAISLVGIPFFISSWGLMGACISKLVLNAILMAMFIAFFLVSYRRDKRAASES